MQGQYSDSANLIATHPSNAAPFEQTSLPHTQAMQRSLRTRGSAVNGLTSVASRTKVSLARQEDHSHVPQLSNPVLHGAALKKTPPHTDLASV